MAWLLPYLSVPYKTAVKLRGNGELSCKGSTREKPISQHLWLLISWFPFLEDIRQKVKSLHWVVDRSCSQFLAPGMSPHRRSFEVYERKSRVWWLSGSYCLV